MKAVLLLILFCSVSILSEAQTLDLVWVKRIGSNLFDEGKSTCIDQNGNVYATGMFSGKVDFDPGPGVFELTSSTLNPGMFITKFDSSGNFIWAKKIGGNSFTVGMAITVDINGNIYTTGSFSGKVDFDPGNSVFELTSTFGSKDIFISKLNASGDFIWAKHLTGFDDASGSSIAVDRSGNAYVTGSYKQTSVQNSGGRTSRRLISSGGGGMVLSKLDSDGNIVWLNNLSDRNEVAGNAITIDQKGFVYTAGSYGGCFLVTKSDASGKFLWKDVYQSKDLSSSPYNIAYSVSVDNNSNVFITGIFSGSVDFDPGPGKYVLTSGPLTDIFVSKLDASGKFRWAKQLLSLTYDNQYNCGFSVTADTMGNVLTTGIFGGLVDFDPGPETFPLKSAAGSTDMFISKLDAEGNFIWAKQIGGKTSPDAAMGSSILVDAKGKIYATGYFDGTVDFDPGSGVYNETSAGNHEIFLLKLAPCTKPSISTLSATSCREYTLNNRTYAETGTYTQYLTNYQGCDSILTLNLTVIPVQTSSVVSACDSYFWHGSSYTETGIYKDTIITANECDSVQTLYLSILTKPVPYLGKDSAICEGWEVKLDPGEFTSYTWQDGSTQRYFSVTRPGTYTVMVGNLCGEAMDERTFIEGVCELVFPTAFTPNNDGLNDGFKILGAKELKDYDLTVYNRFGQLVFETTDFREAWFGTFKGILQNAGTYVWHCHFSKLNGQEYNKKGTVFLIR